MSGMNRSDVATYSQVDPADNETQTDSSMWIPEDVFNSNNNMKYHTNASQVLR